MCFRACRCGEFVLSTIDPNMIPNFNNHSSSLPRSLRGQHLSSTEELPRLTRSPVVTVAVGVGNVISAVSDPGNGRVGALVLGLEEVTGAGLGLRCILLLAAVGGDPLVAQLAASVDVENAVDDAVNAEVGDGLLAAVAAAQGGAGDDCHSTEDV